jgi:hypothetical protein
MVAALKDLQSRDHRERYDTNSKEKLWLLQESQSRQ